MKTPIKTAERIMRENQFKELVKVVLPEKAKKHKWPIRFDHCFLRVIYDNVLGDAWYRIIPRRRESVLERLTDEQLSMCCQLAVNMARSDVKRIQALNNQSLEWRKHDVLSEA